jgi:hypothetical protein
MGFAQVNVGNSTLDFLTVGVQYTTIGFCTPESSDIMIIPPGGGMLFTPPAGMEVFHVGATNGVDVGFSSVPCEACPLGDPGPFTFNWSPDCSHVKIIL